MGYTIARSLRFRAANSNYANLTPAAGTRDKWKMRVNVKRATLNAQQCIVSADTASDDQIYFDSSNRLCWDFAGTTRLVSTAVFRDATDHLGVWEFIYDAANATAALRARVYFKGVEITVWTTDTRSSISTSTGKFNTAVVHNLGRRANGSANYFDGYMSDFAIIDNDATPLFSGQTLTGSGYSVWAPIAPVSPLIFLNFSNNSSVANLGLDTGSRAVSWTMNNFSVTAGATNDSLLDTPTNGNTALDTGLGGQVPGNYCILNPSDPTIGYSGLPTVSNANLTSVNGPTWVAVKGGVGMTAGKWVFEYTNDSGVTGTCYLGIAQATYNSSTNVGGIINMGNNGNRLLNGVSQGSGTGWFGSPGGTVRVEVDMDNLLCTFFVNGVQQGSAIAIPNALPWFPIVENNQSGGTFNFGQRPFANQATAGFKTLCSANMPATTPSLQSTFTGKRRREWSLCLGGRSGRNRDDQWQRRDARHSLRHHRRRNEADHVVGELQRIRIEHGDDGDIRQSIQIQRRAFLGGDHDVLSSASLSAALILSSRDCRNISGKRPK